MALHDATDPVGAALRALAQGGLNTILDGTLDEPAVRDTYGWPVLSAARLPALSRPALAIWRHSEERYQRTARHVERLVTWRFDYQISATPLELVDDRWRLLQRTWAELVDLVLAGAHPSVSAGAEVLVAAGVTEIRTDRTPPTVAYQVPEIAGALHPTFFGQIRIAERPTVTSAAVPWTVLGTTTDLATIGDDGPETVHPAIVGTLTTRS